jgi:glucose/arabinose dehydrogenase
MRDLAQAAVLVVAILGSGLPVRAVQLAPVLSGLSSPVYVGHSRDGTARLFIVEQGGRIRVLQPGATVPTVFLDITTRVLSGGERGLLGLAFHPSYSTNGLFYVYYTFSNPSGDGDIRISRFQVTANPNGADPSSELILLTIPHPTNANHNGGMIEFGPDGFLYAGVGDGGSGNDPPNNAQNLSALLGKILRIDVDHPAGGLNYSSPATNPFVGVPGARPEIFALGMRNPFRFAFDRGTGQLYVGDVGQGAREEVDIVTAGGNYGWRIFEGSLCNTAPGLDQSLCGPGFVPPIAEYAHTGGRCSITGGYVYRGSLGTFPPGAYVYGDFCTGEIFQLLGGAQSLLLDTSLGISSFGEDQAGELYVVGLGGTVQRLAPLFTGGVFVAAADLTGDGVAEIVTGTDAGGVPHVRAFNADGSPRTTSFLAYVPSFTGGVRVAACDFDTPPDGRAEIATAAGPGGGPHVRVIRLDGAGNPAGDLASFFAYTPAFSGGLFVACGDVTGDGVADIITGADAGGGPHVRVFRLDAASPGGVAPVLDFFAFAPAFTGGVRVAAGNIDGSDRASIIVGAGRGGGPHVQAFKLAGSTLQLLASFFAYTPGFTGGVFVAAGPVLGPGPAQILTGAGTGGGPHVRVFTGTGVDTGVSFFAYTPAFAGGVRLATGDLVPGGGHEIVTAPGPGGGPHVRGFTGGGAATAPGFFAY